MIGQFPLATARKATARGLPLFASATLLAGLASQPTLAQETPEAQFKKTCWGCHSVDPNAGPRQGPNLHGVYGRASGQIAGYKYSDALAGAHLTWDEATLDRWLTNPAVLVPGTVMMYRQADPEKRKLIISYLKSLGASGEGQTQGSAAASK